MAGFADGRKTGGKTRGDRVSGKDGIGGERLFVVIGGVVEGRRDLAEAGIGLIVTEKPDGILGLRADKRENVAGVEAGDENGVIIADRLVGQYAVDLPVGIGGDADIGIDAAKRGAGDLRIDAGLIEPLLAGGGNEHVPADERADAVGKDHAAQEYQGYLAGKRPPPRKPACFRLRR
ncbi:hypothetical protein D3C72_792770 [compost metagenome]